MTARSRYESGRATTRLELLFDLVFVVAVAQAGAGLVHFIADGHAGAGVARYLMVFVKPRV
ncbi:low temperature requirement protein A [Micromonospora sp. LZ34]